MNICQKHLVENYNKYVNIFCKKYKRPDEIRAALSKAYIHFENNHIDPDNIEVFMYVAINNQCLNAIRTNKLEKVLNHYETEKDLVRAVEAGYSPAEDIDHRLTIEKEHAEAKEHLNKLSPKVQTIIKQHIYEDKTFAKIAKENNLNYETTKATYRHNMKYLRDMMNGERKDVAFFTKTIHAGKKINQVKM